LFGKTYISKKENKERNAEIRISLSNLGARPWWTSLKKA
jgi:hypothetical protein